VNSQERTSGVVVEAMGVPIGIPVSGTAVDRLRHQWSRALTQQQPRAYVEVPELVGSDAVAHDYAITSRVTLAALEATAGQRINLHAGAVADEEGRVLAVIGASGAGKTTAVALLASRWGYLSDETTSIDDTLAVHAHAKPLSMITDREAPLVKHSLSPDDLGLARPPALSHLHRIVLLHRGDDDSGLVPLAPAHAIAEMVAQTSSLTQLEHPILRLADTIDACGGVWGLRYREFEEQLDDLAHLMDTEGQPPAPRLHHPGVAEVVAGGSDGSWRRTAWLDAMEYDDELVLMVDDRVHVLAGLGVVLWLALESPTTADDLVAEVQALWGAHPDAPALVLDALTLMAHEGMLTPPG